MTGIIRLLVVTIITTGTVWLTASCMVPATACAEGERNLLWQSREQFVALEPREVDTADPAHLNGHPATLTTGQVTTLLSSLQLRRGNDAAEPLFTGQTLDIVAPKLVLALQKAAPGEDVTFAVIGLHKALLGLAKEPRVTTGRLFIREGRLNLIVGLAQQDVNEREDRRLAPFTPGSRQTPALGEWLLQTPAQPAGYTLIRRDWVSVATGWQPSPTTHATEPDQTAPFAKQREHARTPAERLTTLKELYDRGLISEAEYRNKREQILNEL